MNCKIRVPSLLELIDKEILTDTDSESEDSELDNEGDSDREEKLDEVKADVKTNFETKGDFQNKMATIEQKKTFIAMCANIIRNNYDGNPLALESFLDKINLISELTEDNLMAIFISFVK